MKRLTILVAVAVYVLGAQADPRLWGEAGIPVRQGTNVEWTRVSAQDGSGNTLVVWTDQRTGVFQVYAQLINAAGVPQWADSGIPVAPCPNFQYYPMACAVDGGWAIAWFDYHYIGGETGLEYGPYYVQKLDYDGNRLWSANNFLGVRLSDQEFLPYYPSLIGLCHDGSGGVMCAWREIYFGTHIQRISAAGTLAWPSEITVITGQIESEIFTATGDGNGNILLAWMDYSIGSDYDIYAVKITQSGELPWTTNGVVVCNVTGYQINPQICPDGSGGCYIAWNDRRTPTERLYAQRLNDHGVSLWSANGIPIFNGQDNRTAIAPSVDQNGIDGFLLATVCTPAPGVLLETVVQKILPSGAFAWSIDGVQTSPDGVYCASPRVISDQSGGAIVAWTDYRHENALINPQIYATRVSAAGTAMWASGGVPVLSADTYSQDPVLYVSGGSCNVILTELQNNQLANLRVQTLSLIDGTPQGDPLGISVMPNLSEMSSGPQVIALSGGRTAITWMDYRSGDSEIFYQILEPTGADLVAHNGVPLITDNQGYEPYQRDQQMCSDGAGGFFVAYIDQRTGIQRVRMSHVNAAGVVIGDPAGTLIWDGEQLNDQTYPYIAEDGSGGCYIAWSQYDSAFYLDAYLMRVDVSGQSLWANPVIFGGGNEMEEEIKGLIAAPGGACIALWRGGADFGMNLYNLYSAHINADRSLDWNMVICDVDGYYSLAELTSDRAGGAYYAWQDHRISDNRGDIYAQHLNAQGFPQWETNGQLICGDEAPQFDPQIVTGWDGSLFVVWYNGSTLAISGQRLSPAGVPLWPANGLPISDYSHNTSPIQLAPDGSDGLMVAWVDYCDSVSCISGLRLTADGTPANSDWVENGTILKSNPLANIWQFWDFALTADDQGNHVLVWNRYMTFWNNSDIYAQRIAGGGLDVPEPKESAPLRFALEQNYPNPFNPVTQIEFTLDKAAPASLKIYNLNGQLVATLADGVLAAGRHTVSFDGSDLSSGVYFYRLESGSLIQTRKMILLK